MLALILAAALSISPAPKKCEWAVCWLEPDGEPKCQLGRGEMTPDDRIEFVRRHAGKDIALRCESMLEEI